MSTSNTCAVDDFQFPSSTMCMSPVSVAPTSGVPCAAGVPRFLPLDAQASSSSDVASAQACRPVPVFVLPKSPASRVPTRMTPRDAFGADEAAVPFTASTTSSALASFDAAVAKLKESTASPKPVPQPRRRSARNKKATTAKQPSPPPPTKKPLFLPDPASPVSPLFLDSASLSSGAPVPTEPPTPSSPPPKRKRIKASKPGHIPRPRNSFMIYRSAQLKALSDYVTPTGQRLPQSDLSRMIASMWREESPEVRERYVRQAEEEKAEHYRRHPDYRYQPSTSRKKPSDRKSQANTVFPPTPPASVASSGATTPSVLLPPLSIGSVDAGDDSTTPTSHVLSPFTTSTPFDLGFQVPTPAASEAWSLFRSASMTWLEGPEGAASTSGLCEPPALEPAQPSYFDFAFALSPELNGFVGGLGDLDGSMALPTPPLAFEEYAVDGAEVLVDQWLTHAAPSNSFDPASFNLPLSPALTPTLGCSASPQDPFTMLAK